MNDDNMDAAREAFEAWWKDQRPSSLDYTSALVGYLARAASPTHTESAAPMTRDDVERQYRDGIHIASGLPRTTCQCGFCVKHRFGFNSGDGVVSPAPSPVSGADERAAFEITEQMAADWADRNELENVLTSFSTQRNAIEDARTLHLLDPTPTGQHALSDAAAPQAVTLTDEQIDKLAQTHLVVGDDGELFGLYKFARAILSATPAPATADAGERPRECSGDPSNCPDNEGCGCWCSDQTRAALSRSDKS